MRSSLRAAVHSKINSNRKNGIANNTGSRICAGSTDNKPAIAQGGRYDDTLIRENGHWKFKRRVASNDLPSSGPVQTK